MSTIDAEAKDDLPTKHVATASLFLDGIEIDPHTRLPKHPLEPQPLDKVLAIEATIEGDALLPTVLIPIDDIDVPYDDNCRDRPTVNDVADLAKDIYNDGQDTPVIIRRNTTPRPSYDNPQGRKDLMRPYRLVAGFRRITAIKHLRRTYPDAPRFNVIAAKVRALNDEQADIINLRENLHREQLTLLEETRGVMKFTRRGYTDSYIAELLGQKPRWVALRRQISVLEAPIQEAIGDGVLTQNQISQISELPQGDKRFAFLKRIRLSKEGLEALKTETKKANPDKKKHRDRSELSALFNWIWENVEQGCEVTQVLAWCKGDVSTTDMYPKLREMVRVRHGETRAHSVQMPDNI